jgi:hypothetical protein
VSKGKESESMSMVTSSLVSNGCLSYSA